MAKMCKHYNSGLDCGGPIPCPSNTNDKCQVVEKDKVIKAWAMVSDHKVVFAGSTGPYEWRAIPCTITISARDWKRLKGGR